MKGGRPKAKKGTLKRVLRFLVKYYKPALCVVVICLVVSALVNSISSIFTQQILTYIKEGKALYDTVGADGAMAEIYPKIVKTVITLMCIYLT